MSFLHPDNKKKYEDLVGRDWQAHKHKFYGHHKTDLTFIIYLIAIFLWLALIWYISPPMGHFILFIPIVVFIITIMSISSLSRAVEEEMLQANSLSTGLLITLPLLGFITNGFKGDTLAMTRSILAAIVLAILSMVDVWVPEKYISLTKHIRSIFQTGSLTLILFSIYLYYATMGNIPIFNK